jgi:hypothetical protein
MSDHKPTPREKVLASLNKSGYPLEMRVAARAARHTSKRIRQSVIYVDGESGKLRETDVVAQWRVTIPSETRTTFINLVIECKSKPRPWVVFQSSVPDVHDDPQVNLAWTPQQAYPADNWLADRVEKYTENPSRARTIFSTTDHGLATGIVEVTFEGDDRSSEANKAWSAVQAAVSAALGVQDQTRLGKLKLPNRSISTLFLPVVVTSGLLFRCWLDEKDQVDAEEIDRASVLARSGPDSASIRCLVVTEAGLESLFEDATTTLQMFS